MAKADNEKAKEAAPASDTPQSDAPKATIQSVVASLVMNVELSYDQIVEMVREQFPDANTSTRSVASVASRLRKAGVDVPMRKAAKQA